MKEPRWLLESVVLHVHGMLLAEHGGPEGVRDPALLASALDRPRNRYAYRPHITLQDLAAAYPYGIARNHPFTDGNKRTAFVCGALFLELNGLQLTATEVDAALAFEALAAGEMNEPELAQWFRVNSSSA